MELGSDDMDFSLPDFIFPCNWQTDYSTVEYIPLFNTFGSSA